MNFILNQRALRLGRHILKTKQTVRQTAQVFGVSKSTVHYDVSKRLKKINFQLYEKIHKILDDNFNSKHIRGGEATRKKFLNQK
ncbi:MAG: sporulation transcriptional regulator SpoIIID [Clostridia bacterium]|nr:sporulation transcriptional regulator SpoIIID [Clostridia bacterium]MDD3862891.1 sporulation transcriptional regulator SpoIIID [Clostridia bacterium]MDD4408661.1 sporulation transcriptional regulator SpoIIID [Clostridia bacterium]